MDDDDECNFRWQEVDGLWFWGQQHRVARLLIPCCGENTCIRLVERTLTYNILLIYIGIH